MRTIQAILRKLGLLAGLRMLTAWPVTGWRVTGWIVTGWILAGCGANTTLVEQWQGERPDQSETYDKVFVVALEPDPRIRRDVEQTLAVALAEYGVITRLSSDFVERTPQTPINEADAALLDAAARVGADAILVSQAYGVEAADVRDPELPIVKQHPSGTYYDSFSLYWLHQNQLREPAAAGSDLAAGSAPADSEPGQEPMDANFLELKQDYWMEAVMFDARTQRPVWMARAETERARSEGVALENYAKTVARALANDDLILPKSLYK